MKPLKAIQDWRDRRELRKHAPWQVDREDNWLKVKVAPKGSNVPRAEVRRRREHNRRARASRKRNRVQ